MSASKCVPPKDLANVDLPEPGQGTPLTRNKIFSGSALFFNVFIYLLLEVF